MRLNIERNNWGCAPSRALREGALPTCRQVSYTAVPLCQLLPTHVEGRAQLLPSADRPGLALGFNRRDQRARYLRLLRKLLLGKLAVLTPDAERGLSCQSALGDLQWYEFVLSIVQTRLGGVVGLHAG